MSPEALAQHPRERRAHTTVLPRVRLLPVLIPLALAACSAAPPPDPPPFSGPPAAPPAALGSASATPTAEPPPTPALTANPASTASPADTAPPQPILHFALEAPFRLDRRIFPSTKEAFLADLKDRTAWNQGGLGELAGPLPPVPGHPAPKVIIDVTKASGGLRAADAQRVLRKGLWIKVVECFSLAAYKDQKLRGAVKLTASVSATGKVASARATQHNFPDDEVPRCLANQLRAFAMPKAKGRTTLSLEIQIGHGDEPVPPPASLIVAGDGELTPDQMRTAIESAQPAFEECHRAALVYAPELWGRMGIRFHVTEKGKTDEAFEVESRFPDERVSLCLLREARKIVFPKPVGGDIRFIVPLRLWSDRSPIPAAPTVRRP